MANGTDERWFYRAGYWVIPLATSSKTVLRQLDQANEWMSGLQPIHLPKAPAGPTKLTKRKTIALTDKIAAGVRALSERKVAIYKAQPKWNFSDIDVSTAEHVEPLITQFLTVASSASTEYCWTFDEPPSPSWEIHAWKHICYSDLEEICKEARRPWVPEVRVIAAIGSENVPDLFRRAIAKEPEAIAAISFLLPSPDDRISVAKSLCPPDIAETDIHLIPSFLDFGTGLLAAIARGPSLPEAEDARTNLRRLISLKSLTQGLRRRGRPRQP